MNIPTTANTVGSLLVLLAIGNMAMFIRLAITTRRTAKCFVASYCLLAIPLVVAFAARLNIQTTSTLLLAICALLTPLTCYCTLHRRGLRSAVIMAPALSQWILSNFKDLDSDDDGIISSGDLMSYCENPFVTASDLRWARRTQYELSIIGHVISVLISSNPAVGLAVVNLYAISEADAKSYPERIVRAQELEYGA